MTPGFACDDQVREACRALTRPCPEQKCTIAISLFCCVLVCLFGAGQLAESFAQTAWPLQHQSWSTQEGLPQASVHAIFQARDGYLWLATEGGIACFDGFGFKTFNHENEPEFTSDDTTAIAQDAAGSLWFGTSDGLIQRHRSTLRRFGEQDGLPSSVITGLAALPDGSLLALTAAGLARFDGNRFQGVRTPSAIPFAMQAASSDSVWLFSTQGVFQYAHGAISLAALPSSLEEPLLGAQPGADGGFWLRTKRSVTLLAAQQQHTWQIGSDLPGSRVQALLLDRHGVAWIGTNRGLFTLAANSSARPQAVAALVGESVLSLLQDREGNLWIGTETTGLHALRPRAFTAEPAAADDAVSAVVEASDGSTWFGTRDDGLRRLVRGKAVTPVPLSALTSPVILALAAGTHGDIWAGTPDGLNHVEGQVVHRYVTADGLPDDFVRSLLVGGHDDVWIGTRYGLAHWVNGAIRTLTREDGLASSSIGPLLLSHALSANSAAGGSAREDLWIGTAAGLSHWLDGSLHTYVLNNSPVDNIVTSLGQDAAGNIWAGIHKHGLAVVHGDKLVPLRVATLPVEIHALTADRTGHLWLRGDHGIYRVALGELDACLADSVACAPFVSHYNSADGMPSDELVSGGFPAVAQTGNGDLWFATRKGLAIASPSHLPVNTVAPPVTIDRFTIDDKEQPLTDTIRTAAGRHRYSFDYVGLSFTMPARTRYRYKLEGFDRDWIEAGTRRTAYYTSLPARRYVFRVTAENNDGVWNEVGASVPFMILPPFYLRWWFYLLLILILAGSVFLLFRLRLQRVQRRFDLVLNERTRMAREIHDTLAQDFVSVSLQLELTSHMIGAGSLGEASQQLRETRSLVKTGLESARQSIWNLRATAAQDSLPARLAAVVDRYARSLPPVKTKIGGQYRKLDPTVESEVLRIAQEGLSNIDRHAAAKQVWLELRYTHDLLQLEVRDDGLGFSYDGVHEPADHYGLRGMRERAAELGGQLTVISARGEGTTVTLLVPLKVGED